MGALGGCCLQGAEILEYVIYLFCLPVLSESAEVTHALSLLQALTCKEEREHLSTKIKKSSFRSLNMCGWVSDLQLALPLGCYPETQQ